MPRRLSILLTLLYALGLGACARPQYVEFHRLGPEQAPSVRGMRYAGNSRNPIDDLWIDLDKAPPFQVRLPDGQWLDSRGLNRLTLVAHGLRIEHYGKLVSAIWHPHFSLLEVAAGRYYSLSFHIAADGHASGLALSACGRTQTEVLRTADGSHSFAFPLSARELQTLFGPMTEVERLYILTGFSCF